MLKSQKRKVERNSMKKQTSKFNIISTILVDTKSIIENKNQFNLIDEKKLSNFLKENQKLKETIVLVNFGSKSQNNFGILNIIHEYVNDSDSKNLIKSALTEISEICLKSNNESVFHGLSEVNVLDYLTLELKLDPSKSIKENISNKALDSAMKLMELNNKISEAA